MTSSVYSLSGTDAGSFGIDPATGQLRTRSVLDPAVKDTYTVTIDVHDGFDASYDPSDATDASIVVTITVTAVSRIVPGGIAVGGGGGPAGPSPSSVEFEWNVTRDIEALDDGHGSPTGLWSDAPRCGCLRTAPAPTTPSTPTTSRRANVSRSASSRSTKPTARPAASGPTASRRGSPTAAGTSSSPTACLGRAHRDSRSRTLPRDNRDAARHLVR